MAEHSKLLNIVKQFRKGILDGRGPISMCYAVCAPLSAYLQVCGYDNKLVCGEVNSGYWQEHYWLDFGDFIVDPTASQFKNPQGGRMPQVYIGSRPQWYIVLDRNVRRKRGNPNV